MNHSLFIDAEKKLLSKRIGIEIDFDFSKPLSETESLALCELVHTHGLLVAREQSLARDDQIRIVEYLGQVPKSGHDGVSTLDNRVPEHAGKFASDFASGQLVFHSDDAFSPDPTRYISLFGRSVVSEASSTQFASATAVLSDLPGDLLHRLTSAEALHVFGRYTDRRNRLRTSETNDPHSFHPVIWTHPKTGEALLYVNYLMTDSIYSLSLEESDALLESLFNHLYAPKNTYEHFWRTGDLLLWDNFLLQHARGAVNHNKVGARQLERVISVTKGFFETHPQFRTEIIGY